MTDRLKGKTCLITAAGAGIGQATARAFAAQGARVWATDFNAALLEPLNGIANLTTRTLDVTDNAAIEALVAEIAKENPVNVLFNCAGFVHHGSLMEATDEQWDFAFNLNVRAMWKLAKAVVPGMLEYAKASGKSASIVNVASVAGSVKGLPNRFVYGTSKAAVVGLTKSIAADFVTKGIRCNAIGPGTVDTPSLGDRINAFADPVQARKDFIARQPMGRLATASEIAPLVVYLASDEAAFCTGNIYCCDGGMTI